MTPPDSTAKVRRYFMRATAIAERVGDEKCDCDTPCQCVVYASDHDAALAAERASSAAALAERDALLRRALAKISHDYNCSASRGPEIDCTCLRYDIRALLATTHNQS